MSSVDYIVVGGEFTCKADLYALETLALSGSSGIGSCRKPLGPSDILDVYAVLERAAVTCVVLKSDV